jgi:hypothetical protein
MIEAMMLAWEWERGKSHVALAEEWGLSVGAVSEYATEVARRIKGALSDDEYRGICLGDLEEVTRLATDKEQYQAAIAAIKLRLEARGLLVQRHHVEQVAAMTPREIAVSVVQDPQIRTIVSGLLNGDIQDAEFTEPDGADSIPEDSIEGPPGQRDGEGGGDT